VGAVNGDDLLVERLRTALRERAETVPAPPGMYERIRRAHRRARIRDLIVAVVALATVIAAPLGANALRAGHPRTSMAGGAGGGGASTDDPTTSGIMAREARGPLARDQAVLAGAAATAAHGGLASAGTTLTVAYAGQAAGFIVAVVVGKPVGRYWTTVTVGRPAAGGTYRLLPMAIEQASYGGSGEVPDLQLVATAQADSEHWFAIVLEEPGTTATTSVDVPLKRDCTFTSRPAPLPLDDGAALVPYTGSHGVQLLVTPPHGLDPPTVSPFMLSRPDETGSALATAVRDGGAVSAADALVGLRVLRVLRNAVPGSAPPVSYRVRTLPYAPAGVGTIQLVVMHYRSGADFLAGWSSGHGGWFWLSTCLPAGQYADAVLIARLGLTRGSYAVVSPPAATRAQVVASDGRQWTVRLTEGLGVFTQPAGTLLIRGVQAYDRAGQPVGTFLPTY
jgi:hypothetical protein